MTHPEAAALADQAQNTDRELWRGPDEGNGSYYADSIHVTAQGAIGINVGGTVYVKPLREWHALARSLPNPVVGREEIARAIRDYCNSQSAGCVSLSHGEWRIYYAGILLDGLTDAILQRLRAPASPVGETNKKLDGDLGIVLSALRMLEEATGETFDDDGGDVAAIERDWKARNDIQSSDGGVESKAGGLGRSPLEHASGKVAEGGQNATTGKDALADIAQAVKPAQPAASNRRISEQPETAYSADRQVAGVAPGPSEATPSPAGVRLATDNPDPKPLHPYCQKCGWRKGGLDSWDGVACKCGESEPVIRRVE